jgi:hypothetical protein
MTTTPKTRTSKPMGANALTGTPEAKRQAAIVLEVLSGLRRTEDASEAMKVPLPRYYLLETRALQGMISALEPRPVGRQRRPESEIAELKKEKDRLQRELHRSQALVRASQRALGIPQPPKPDDKSKLPGTGRRKRRATVRAVRTVKALRRGLDAAPASTVASPSHEDKTSATKP